MKRIVTFCAVLLLATMVSAQSQFTTAEKAEVGKLREAQFSLFTVLETSCGVTANAGDCAYVNLAGYNLGVAIGWLLGINVAEFVGDRAVPSGGWALLAGPRADVVLAAWQALDFAISYANQAAGFAENSDMVSALSKMNNANRGLSYANPYPVFVSSSLGTNSENQFGPHGWYSEAQLNLWGGYRYAGFGAAAAWLKAISSGEVPECPPLPPPQPQIDNRREALKSVVKFSRRSMQILHMSAQVYSPSSGWPDYMSAYRTDAEELLTEAQGKTALTEIHLGAGPADNTGSLLATSKEFLAAAEMQAGSCLIALGAANRGAFVRSVGDGWRHHVAWFGSFNVIK